MLGAAGTHAAPWGFVLGPQSKTLILSTNVDKKSLGTEFSILTFFDPHLLIVFDCRLSGVVLVVCFL